MLNASMGFVTDNRIQRRKYLLLSLEHMLLFFDRYENTTHEKSENGGFQTLCNACDY